MVPSEHQLFRREVSDALGEDLVLDLDYVQGGRLGSPKHAIHMHVCAELVQLRISRVSRLIDGTSILTKYGQEDECDDDRGRSDNLANRPDSFPVHFDLTMTPNAGDQLRRKPADKLQMQFV